MVKRGDIGVHLATLNLFRESDGSVQLTVASGLGALRELEHADGRIGGLGEPAKFRPVDYVDILAVEAADNIRTRSGYPIPMVLHCPACGAQHIDAPSPGWDNPPHTSHKCVADGGCGCIWRPCDLPTVGVERVATAGKSDSWPDILAASLSDEVD